MRCTHCKLPSVATYQLGKGLGGAVGIEAFKGVVFRATKGAFAMVESVAIYRFTRSYNVDE